MKSAFEAAQIAILMGLMFSFALLVEWAALRGFFWAMSAGLKPAMSAAHNPAARRT